MTNFPTLLYKYDIDGVDVANKEMLYQRMRSQAQELVLRELKHQAYGVGDLPPPHPCHQDWRLVRDVTANDPGPGAGVDVIPVFIEEAGALYGSPDPPKHVPMPEGREVPRLLLNPMGLQAFNHMLYHEKWTLVLRFRNASLIGDPGVVSTSTFDDCRIFVPSGECMVPLHSLLDMPAQHTRVLDRAISIVQMSCDNYYHWTMECLPRLVVSLEYLRNNSIDSSEVTLVLPAKARAFAQQALEILEIDHMNIVEHDPQQTLLVRDLIAVDWSRTDQRPGLEMTPARTALNRARQALAWSSIDPDSIRRRSLVFISRNSDHLSGSRSRAITNEAYVLHHLHQAVEPLELEMEVFHGDQHDLRSTIEMFRRAKIVIGVHGAGLANILYCAPGTAVLEIALSTPRHRDYMHASASLGHSYWIHGQVREYAIYFE